MPPRCGCAWCAPTEWSAAEAPEAAAPPVPAQVLVGCAYFSLWFLGVDADGRPRYAPPHETALANEVRTVALEDAIARLRNAPFRGEPPVAIVRMPWRGNSVVPVDELLATAEAWLRRPPRPVSLRADDAHCRLNPFAPTMPAAAPPAAAPARRAAPRAAAPREGATATSAAAPPAAAARRAAAAPPAAAPREGATATSAAAASRPPAPKRPRARAEKWSDDAVARLRALHAQHPGQWRIVAEAMGPAYTHDAVRHKVDALGLARGPQLIDRAPMLRQQQDRADDEAPAREDEPAPPPAWDEATRRRLIELYRRHPGKWTRIARELGGGFSPDAVHRQCDVLFARGEDPAPAPDEGAAAPPPPSPVRDDGEAEQIARETEHAAACRPASGEAYDVATLARAEDDEARAMLRLRRPDEWDAELVQALVEINVLPPLVSLDGAYAQGRGLASLRCSFRAPDGSLVRDVWLSIALLHLMYPDWREACKREVERARAGLPARRPGAAASSGAPPR